MADVDEEWTSFIADHIRQHREERGLTLEALAAAAGVHRTSLGLIERGKRGMTIGVAARLCWALDLSLAEVVASRGMTKAKPEYSDVAIRASWTAAIDRRR